MTLKEKSGTKMATGREGHSEAEPAVAIEGEELAHDDHAYVLTDRVRNAHVPINLLAVGAPFDVEETGFSAEREVALRHRAKSRLDLDGRRRASFIDEARSAPEELYERVAIEKARSRFDEIQWGSAAKHQRYLRLLLSHFDPVLGGHTEPTGRGEMWWGETWFQLPGRIGMHGVWNDAGLLMLGGLDWDDGDLMQTGYHVFSSFFLDPARMPAANRVRSTPGGVLAGEMFGFTGGSAVFGTFFDGDQWSKCRLKLHQRAFAVNPANPVDAVPAAPFAVSEINVVDVDGRFNHQVGALPGGLAYPPIDIHLDKNRILRIDLEVDLFIQLEGEASIRFGGIGHSNPALYQLSQWMLQPF